MKFSHFLCYMSGDFFSVGLEWSQETFSAKGQMVNIKSTQSHASLVQPFNSAVVSGCSPRQDGNEWAWLGSRLQKQARGLDTARAVVCPPMLEINNCHLKVKSYISPYVRSNLLLIIDRILLCKTHLSGDLRWAWSPPHPGNHSHVLSWVIPCHTLRERYGPHREAAEGGG